MKVWTMNTASILRHNASILAAAATHHQWFSGDVIKLLKNPGRGLSRTGAWIKLCKIFFAASHLSARCRKMDPVGSETRFASRRSNLVLTARRNKTARTMDDEIQAGLPMDVNMLKRSP
jgi:hypothetical protein